VLRARPRLTRRAARFLSQDDWRPSPEVAAGSTSECDLVAAFQRQDSGLVGARDFEPSPSMIWRALLTCWAFDRQACRDRSRADPQARTLPPIDAAMAAIGIWLRPAQHRPTIILAAEAVRGAAYCASRLGWVPCRPGCRTPTARTTAAARDRVQKMRQIVGWAIS
jgi:hypothetical protein